MAEVTARKRGKFWEYRFEGANVEGKRKQYSKSGFKTKKEALEEGNKAFVEYHNTGVKFNPVEMSVADFVDYWFEHDCVVNNKFSTQEYYRWIVNGYIKPRFGKYPLRSITSAILTDYVSEIYKDGCTKSKMDGIVTALKRIFEYAYEPMHFIPSSPTEHMKVPKNDRKPNKRETVDMDDYDRILNIFPVGNRFHILFKIGFHCGLRIAEVIGLTWDDIDFGSGHITVNKQIQKRYLEELDQNGKRKFRWCIGCTKTKGSVRRIKLDSELLGFLAEEKNRQEENRKNYGEFYTVIVPVDDKDKTGNNYIWLDQRQVKDAKDEPMMNFVCVGENGRLTTSDNFKNACKKIHKKEIKFEFHSLRHTHATLLVENGANIKAIQMRLGHSSIATTMNTYVHNTEKMEDEAVDIFESILPTK